MRLPEGVTQLTTVEEVRHAWGDLFIVPADGDVPEHVAFENNSKVAIAHSSVFVQLRSPVKAGPNIELTDVLEIREPTVNDIRQTDTVKGDTSKAITLLSVLCTIPAVEVNKMKASDMSLISSVLSYFL